MFYSSTISIDHIHLLQVLSNSLTHINATTMSPLSSNDFFLSVAMHGLGTSTTEVDHALDSGRWVHSPSNRPPLRVHQIGRYTTPSDTARARRRRQEHSGTPPPGLDRSPQRLRRGGLCPVPSPPAISLAHFHLIAPSSRSIAAGLGGLPEP
jgi:hypothetical protein